MNTADQLGLTDPFSALGVLSIDFLCPSSRLTSHAAPIDSRDQRPRHEHNAYFLLGPTQPAQQRLRLTTNRRCATRHDPPDCPYLGSICFKACGTATAFTILLRPLYFFTTLYSLLLFANAVIADGDPPAYFPLCTMTVST